MGCGGVGRIVQSLSGAEPEAGNFHLWHLSCSSCSASLAQNMVPLRRSALPARATLEEPPAAPPGSHAWLRAALADGRPAAPRRAAQTVAAARRCSRTQTTARAGGTGPRAARTDGEPRNSIVMLQSYVDTCAPLGGGGHRRHSAAAVAGRHGPGGRREQPDGGALAPAAGGQRRRRERGGRRRRAPARRRLDGGGGDWRPSLQPTVLLQALPAPLDAAPARAGAGAGRAPTPSSRRAAARGRSRPRSRARRRRGSSKSLR